MNISNLTGRVFGLTPQALKTLATVHPEAKILNNIATKAKATLARRRSIVRKMQLENLMKPTTKRNSK